MALATCPTDAQLPNAVVRRVSPVVVATASVTVAVADAVVAVAASTVVAALAVGAVVAAVAVVIAVATLWALSAPLRQLLSSIRFYPHWAAIQHWGCHRVD